MHFVSRVVNVTGPVFMFLPLNTLLLFDIALGNSHFILFVDVI